MNQVMLLVKGNEKRKGGAMNRIFLLDRKKREK